MKLRTLVLLSAGVFLLASCSLFKGGKDQGRSSTTGWEYNTTSNGGFEYRAGFTQNLGPGLKFVEGGTFTMGRVDEDVMYDWNNIPRRVTVSSFYIDETEVRNVDYREYLYWIERVYPDKKEKYLSALPDTLVWRDELSYNEPYLENYLRHPSYSNYPVVGVSWIQANEFCDWRTDRVNEQILIDNGILAHDLDQKDENIFTTESYLAGLYNGVEGDSPMQDLKNEGSTRRVNKTDGFILPRYRLPSEAEWEYAALGLIGNTSDELVSERRIYPWNGNHMRNANKKDRGMMMANFVRGRGDYMGAAGALNDGYEITAPVDAFPANDYGLYCMAGNVNEWVYDVYRPLSSMDVNEFQPLRGNVYTQYKKDEEGNVIRDEYGNLVKDTVANYKNFLDGDYQSRVIEADQWDTEENMEKNTTDMYQSGDFTPRISDNVRVYKGGSWKDRAFWLSPGARRYLDENNATNDIGFRCAMTHMGGQE